MTPPYVVGLTGGIGSGKSAAAERFAHHGATVVDTDAIAHALTAPGGGAMAQIRQAFGEVVVTPAGALDRAVMRELAFSDPEQRQRLEAILHPLIRAESERLSRTAHGPYVILMVPLLIESGTYRERCDRLCVVDCPEQLQVERVRARSGLADAQIRTIMAAQASRDARLAAADDVIDNSGGLEALYIQVDRLHAGYIAAAATRARGQ